jgi:hypothetical protein
MGIPSPENLLTESELADIREFSVEFSRTGESLLNASKGMRQPHLRAFVMLLHSLGAITLQRFGRDMRVKGTGRLAQHFPEILSIYLSDSLTLLGNWNNTHTIPEDTLSALELLRQMELRRVELTRQSGKSPLPLAERPVAFALFHAIDQKGRDCYLFEINKDWRRLNFVGGKQESHDQGDYSETVLREISEELGISRDRISLSRLNSQPLDGYGLSGNVGSLARYPCVLFGVKVDDTFKTGLQYKWLTEDTIRECMSIRDCPLMVNPVYLRFLLAGRPSQLSRTPISIPVKVRSANLSDIVEGHEIPVNRWIRVLSENKDLLAAILTALAAIISLTLAFS